MDEQVEQDEEFVSKYELVETPQPIPDVFAMTVDADWRSTDAEITYMRKVFRQTAFLQYRDKIFIPADIRVETFDWIVADTIEEVEAFQPAHDCPHCQLYAREAASFLRTNPGKRVFVANVTYREIWKRRKQQ